MNSFGSTEADRAEPNTVSTATVVPIVSGLAAIALAYLTAAAGLGWLGIVLTVSVAALFAAACLASRPRERRAALAVIDPPGVDESVFDEIEDRLVALDEANEVFGTTLNAADMFRLVSSRIGEIFPLAGAALVVPDEAGETLRFVHFDGENAEMIRGLEIAAADGLAGRAFASRQIEIDNRLTLDKTSIGIDRLKPFTSAAAIPLLQDGEPFGIFELFAETRIGNDDDTMKLLDAIGDHVTPIFRNSLAFERSLSSALTDALTGLPNERAFYMVLENQLAESHRHRDERPLTVLSIDIRDFGAVNSMLGHAVGDRMLEFVAAILGQHLRKMDFLARTINDEFSIILPTASEKMALDVIERISASFSAEEFEISDGEGVSVVLNIGWATFWKDGETSDQLLRAAQQRKRQAKSEKPSGVLWFPKEYVN
ncbi:MAG: diguanylate cyclase [Pyrinomonadaceae bacterium]